MLQHRGVPTAMLTTRGFRDILELRRGFKEILFDIRLPPPQQIVRREWRLPIAERINHRRCTGCARRGSGSVRREENRGRRNSCDRSLFPQLVSQRRSRASRRSNLEGMLPGCGRPSLVRRHAKIREFERLSTTVVNAFLSPLLRSYRSLNDGATAQRLSEAAVGHAIERWDRLAEQAGRLGCAALLSGPAGGVAAARVRRELRHPQCHRRRHGRHQLRRITYSGWSSRNALGILVQSKLRRPADARDLYDRRRRRFDILGIDDGGALRVGRQSAGARPGPACYGLGGADANSDRRIFISRRSQSRFLSGWQNYDPAGASGGRAPHWCRREIGDVR